MILLSANEAATLLAANISNSTTTILLQTGTGALFPNPGVNEYFNLILNDVATGQNYEIAWCTARTGDSCTVLRGQEGTTARAFVLGDFAFNNITAISTSTARAFAAQRTPTLPYTMLSADQGVPQYCGTTGTITLPAVAGIQDGYLAVIVCTSGSATITVNTNSATVALPGGNVTTTFPLAGVLNSVILQWNAGLSIWYQISSSITSFNTRTGAIVLSSGDVIGALGYTPANQTALLWQNFKMGAFSDFGTGTTIAATESFTPATNGQVLLTANAGCTGVMTGLVLSGSGFTPEGGSASNFGQTSVGVYTAVLDVTAADPVTMIVTVSGSVSGAIGVAANYFFMPAP